MMFFPHEIILNSKFPLGKMVTTIGVHKEINFFSIIDAFRRYTQGDWGEVDKEDKKQNDWALENGERLLGSYKDMNGKKFWIITERDRSVTTVLKPEEY